MSKRVHMVGQHDPSDNFERVPLLYRSYRLTKCIDTFNQQVAGTIGQVDGEE
jgi:hypothetical protein